jgi:hypothetical protein
MPAPHETVPAARSTTTPAGIASSDSAAAESAMSLNECRVPTTRSRSAPATIACTSSSADGRFNAMVRRPPRAA